MIVKAFLAWVCVKTITCSTACKQLQSWACKLRTDSRGSRWRSCSWCSARWGLSPLLKLSSASCRREACLCASSSACLTLSASMANRAAWARDSSASAFSAAHDYKRQNTEHTFETVSTVAALTQTAISLRWMQTCPTTYLPELCVSSCDPTASVPCGILPAPVWAGKSLHRGQKAEGWGVYQGNPGPMENAPRY